MKEALGTIFFVLLNVVSISFAQDPTSIIKKADEIRNPSESFIMKVTVKSSDSNLESEFEVYTKGSSKTLIRTLKPRRDKGRNLLMLDEFMWIYIPNLKRAVRVSLSQKLSGQAANGDISRMRWSGDYSVVIEKENAQEWQLMLTENKKGLTYSKVRAWIEKGTYRPIRAEYLSKSGKRLKLAFFGKYKKMANKVRPSRITIQDAIRPSNSSVINIVQMKVKPIANSKFNRNNLK